MNDSSKNVSAATTETEATHPVNDAPNESAPSATEKAVAPLALNNICAATVAPEKREGAEDEEAKNRIDESYRRVSSAEWRVCGETVPGASHLRAGIPNQDALLQLRASSVGLPVIISISDGHGSNKCFRSDRGSRFAVHLAAALVNETLNGTHTLQGVKEFEEGARGRLPTEMVKRWRNAVDADMQREPLQEAEFERLIEKDGARARVLVEANPYLAYGATLLLVALTSSFALYMQLGDGEILTVSDAGEVTQPLAEDSRLLANETTSLCLNKAADDFRFAVRPLADSPPALILLTTDGYANSFSTIAGFHQVGTDLIEMMRTDGFDSVNRSIRGWLEEATQAGSGDDCTLAFIVRMDAVMNK